jgi:20S proteasome subunit beta 7
LKVLYYRDCRTINRVQFSTVKLDGSVAVSEPVELKTKWDYERFRTPHLYA